MLITRESELREAKAEVVKNMSKKGFTLEQITMATGLTLDEIMKILGLSRY